MQGGPGIPVVFRLVVELGLFIGFGSLCLFLGLCIGSNSSTFNALHSTLISTPLSKEVTEESLPDKLEEAPKQKKQVNKR